MEDELISHIISEQQADGGFLSYSSAIGKDLWNTTHHTTFVSSLILSALMPSTNPQLNDIRHKLATFILKQRSTDWTWNYWTRSSKESVKLPYPDDADDTFCALAALYQYNNSLLTGEALASVVNGLTQIESNVGGPYYTWYTSSKDWHDVDLAVNNNIAFFLSLQDIELPHITTMTEHALKQRKFDSAYYPDELPVLYFMSRWYSGKYQEILADTIASLQRKDGSWGSPLLTALAVSSLSRLYMKKSHRDKGLSWLRKNSQEILKPYQICFDPVSDGTRHVSGASTLTAAFVLEALALDDTHITSAKSIPKNYIKAIKAVQAKIASIQPEIQHLFNSTLAEIQAADADTSIVLLPRIFAQCLKKNEGVSIELVDQLCQAHLFGWIAYTLYDDILDESHQEHKLPLANMCLRAVSDIYLGQTPKSFHEEFHKIMDGIDEANMWELTYARNKQKSSTYTNLSTLANKSLGHALGPLAILYTIGFEKESEEYQHILGFFRHYIIARQLGDDAHDWEEDLEANNITPVVAMLLGDSTGEKHPNEVFWTQTILRVCHLIEENIKQAQSHLEQCSEFMDTIPFNGLLESLTNMVNITRRKQKDSSEFLELY